MQDICNGSKHFNRQTSQQTKVAGAFDSGAFDSAAFDTRHLEIEVDVGGKKRWVLAEIVMENVVMFWRDFFHEHSPYKSDLPISRARFTEFK